jgi:hypothetical protein
LAALAVAEPALLAVDLEQHLADVATLGDAVAVAAVRAADVVGVVEVHAGADGDGLLPAVQVHEAGHGAGLHFATHAFLELADRPHAAIGFQQHHRVVGHRRLLPARDGRRRGARCPSIHKNSQSGFF